MSVLEIVVAVVIYLLTAILAYGIWKGMCREALKHYQYIGWGSEDGPGSEGPIIVVFGPLALVVVMILSWAEYRKLFLCFRMPEELFESTRMQNW
jgi:hypothetical protein